MNRANRSPRSGRATHEKKRRATVATKEKEDNILGVAYSNANDRSGASCLEKEVQTEDEWEGREVKDADGHANEFDKLCDHVTSNCTAFYNAFHDFLSWKDEMLQQALPSSVLLRLTLISGRLYRTYCGMRSPVSELVELVRLYSLPWEKKSTVLKKLQDDCKIKQGQLNVALHKMEMFAIQEQRMARERRIMNWARLFTKVTNRNSHGRRWKFLIQSLKDRIADGLPLLPSKESEMPDEEVTSQRRPANARQFGSHLKVEQDDEADSTAVQRDSTFSPESLDTVTTDDQKSHRRVRFASDDGDSSDDSEVSEELDFRSMTSPSGGSDTTRGTGVRTPPDPPAPKVETADAATWTHEKEYDKFLHVRVFRPTEFEDSDVYCTLALGSQLVTSRVFTPPKPPGEEESVDSNTPIVDPSIKSLASRSSSRLTSSRISLASQSRSKLKSSSVTRIGHEKCDEFKFNMLSDDKIVLGHTTETEIEESVKQAQPSLLRSGSLSARLSTSTMSSNANSKTDAINVAVHSNVPGKPMVAMTSIAISSLSAEDYYGRDSPGEDSVDAVPYDVMFLKGGGVGQVNLACFWTREERVRTKTRGTVTEPIERVAQSLGYVHPKTPPVLNNCEVQVEEEDIVDIVQTESSHTPEGYVREDHVAELMMKHAAEMEVLQTEYEKRLDSLTTTLNQMRSEAHWTAVRPATQSRSNTSTRSNTQTKNRGSLLGVSSETGSPRQPRQHHQASKLYGRSFPEDFLSRLEHFANESIRRQEELTQRVKSEVAESCERQMASLHRLDTRARPMTQYSEEEICLPAMFMPTKTRNVYTPRAHSYFHPMGSGVRVTQPPSVFKLPSIPGHVATLNLYNVGHDFVARGPEWLRQEQIEAGRHTATPPPSNVNVLEV